MRGSHPTFTAKAAKNPRPPSPFSRRAPRWEKVADRPDKGLSPRDGPTPPKLRHSGESRNPASHPQAGCQLPPSPSPARREKAPARADEGESPHLQRQGSKDGPSPKSLLPSPRDGRRWPIGRMRASLHVTAQHPRSSVIPAKAGIQLCHPKRDASFRWPDGSQCPLHLLPQGGRRHSITFPLQEQHFLGFSSLVPRQSSRLLEDSQ
jgi:hypothetical protein